MTKPNGSAPRAAALVATLCLALGACDTAREASDSSLEASVPPVPGSQMQALASPSSSTTATTVPAGAVASLPEDAGAVASVRGHGYVDGFRQDILLKGGALRGVENSITVLARTSSQATLDERVPLFKPTESAIRSEIGRAFPHVAMQVADRQSSNTYGSYGLALGRASDKVRCVYMWQWIDATSLPPDVPGPMSIRVRLCKPDTTFDALAALLDRLTIQRDTGAAQADASAIVDPPSEDKPEPRRHIVHVKHRPHRLAAVHHDETVMTYPAPMTAAYAPPPAAPRSAVDLPPQAFMGPGAHPSPLRQD